MVLQFLIEHANTSTHNMYKRGDRESPGLTPQSSEIELVSQPFKIICILARK